MQFRRDLDFDDLIETIDQLADEEIDEVVDWQLTRSPAAKTERTGASRVSNPMLDASRWAFGNPRREPQWLRDLQDATNAYTMEQLQEMRRVAWREGNRSYVDAVEARIAAQNAPRRRTELPTGNGAVVIAPDVSMIMAGPSDGRVMEPINYRRIEYGAQTMDDPMRGIRHVRLWWTVTGDPERRYQQTAFSQDTLIELRTPVPVLQADVTPQHRLVLELDRDARDGIRLFMDTAS